MGWDLCALTCSEFGFGTSELTQDSTYDSKLVSENNLTPRTAPLGLRLAVFTNPAGLQRIHLSTTESRVKFGATASWRSHPDGARELILFSKQLA